MESTTEVWSIVIGQKWGLQLELASLSEDLLLSFQSYTDLATE